jgi:hypothetical protein
VQPSHPALFVSAQQILYIPSNVFDVGAARPSQGLAGTAVQKRVIDTLDFVLAFYTSRVTMSQYLDFSIYYKDE